MIKKLFLVALVTAALGAGTRPVLAQTHISGNVTTIQTFNTGPAVDQGLFKVAADEIGLTNEYQISVTYLSTYSGSTTMPSFTDDILVKLFSGPGGTVLDPITVGAGGVGAFAYTPSPSAGGKYEFSDPTPGPGGGSIVTLGQTFVGDVFVSGPAGITGASFTLATQDGVDGSGQGFFTPSVTPEGASLLLLLPGLIPVAVGLRRRRLNKPAGE